MPCYAAMPGKTSPPPVSTFFVVTDTVCIDNAKQMDSIKVISVAPLIAEAIKRIHTGESVGALFR
jgi:phosphoribosylpyrophosphate synthetase